jgi:hypothetical protein
MNLCIHGKCAKTFYAHKENAGKKTMRIWRICIIAAILASKISTFVENTPRESMRT